MPFTIKAFGDGDRLIEKIDEYAVSAVMLDSAEPGSGQVFDWSLSAAVPVGSYPSTELPLTGASA